MIQRPFSPLVLITIQSSGILAGALLLFTLLQLPTNVAFASKDKNDSAGMGFAVELPYAEADVASIVQSVVEDHIIRGTYVYEREKILNDAVSANSSSSFGSWRGPGRAFYKVRKDALAPRNFKDSADIGAITVRYIVHGTSTNSTHLEILAVFVEDGTKRVHPSNISVESAEFTEIQNQLQTLQRDRQRSESMQADKRREEEQAAMAAKQASEESAAYEAVESSVSSLQKRASELQRTLEVRVQYPNAELKAAPFHSATSLAKLPLSSDVLVEIVTTYWYGVETVDGRRGWLRRDQVGTLP
ncbi:MAG TPA: hypothetical protein VH079_00545 [Terriglobales bacterium]|nr:hypothetical protein [Terriglobales bacterium]